MKKKELLNSAIVNISRLDTMHEITEIKNLCDMPGVACSAYLYYSLLIYCYLTENDTVSDDLQINVQIDDKVFSTENYKELLDSLKNIRNAQYFSAEIRTFGDVLKHNVSLDKFDDDLLDLVVEESFSEGFFRVLASLDSLKNVTYKNIISDCENYFIARIADGVCNFNDEIFMNSDLPECEMKSLGEEWYNWSILGSIEYKSFDSEYETVYENLKDIIRKYAPKDEVAEYCESAWTEEEFGSNLLTPDIQWITSDLNEVKLMLGDMNRILADYKDVIMVEFYGNWLLMDSLCVARIVNTDKGLVVKCLKL